MLAVGRLNSMKNERWSWAWRLMTVIPALRRLRQDSCHETQASLGLVWDPMEREGTAQIPRHTQLWTAWLAEEPKAGRLPTGSQQSWLSTTVTCEPGSCQLLSRPPRLVGCSHESSQTRWVAVLRHESQNLHRHTHHCPVFSKSFFSSGLGGNN